MLKKYPQVCERCVPNKTHPNGRPTKGMGGEVQGNWTIDMIFVINRNFLNKYYKNQKILMNKMSFISNFTHSVQISLGPVKKWVTS